MNNRPKVGVAVLVIKDHKVLLGKRKKTMDKGHGLRLAVIWNLERLLKLAPKENYLKKPNRTIFMIVEKFSENIPIPLFLPLENLVYTEKVLELYNR